MTRAKAAPSAPPLPWAADALHIALSTVTLTEVLTGPHKAGLTALAKRYEKALCQYEVVPVTVPIAALAAQLRVQHRLKLPDALQLATALEAGATAFAPMTGTFRK